MARMHTWISLAALGFTLTGCVSIDQYKASEMERARLVEQCAVAQRDASTANSEAEAYKDQIRALMGTGTNKDAVLANSMQQLSALQAQYDELSRKYDDAVKGIATAGSGPLPAQLNDALVTFAQENPDLIEFDSARGMVKFKSDVTFAVGDAELNSRAREVLGRFAQILDSSSARGYELLVAGHTDNQPVQNRITIEKGHKNNWYLSAHRAISVAQELMHDGVSPVRVGCVGYADQRPIASNDTEAGKAQNRRVEVLILPTEARGNAVLASDRVPAVAAPARHVMNKDSEVTTPAAPDEPQMNK
jgi:chemotaxis protein MotB